MWMPVASKEYENRAASADLKDNLVCSIHPDLQVKNLRPIGAEKICDTTPCAF